MFHARQIQAMVFLYREAKGYAWITGAEFGAESAAVHPSREAMRIMHVGADKTTNGQ
jgi:hypothetical protein